MIATIQKWGNSLGVRIPQTMASEIHLREGTSIEMKVDKKRIILIAAKKAKPSLSSLLKSVNPQNQHREILTGEAQGKEIW